MQLAHPKSSRRSLLLVYACAIPLAILLLTHCGEEATCTQAQVDRCYNEAGCDAEGVCRVTAEKMNSLCRCFDEFGCDQPWYHAYCDDAPYDTDGGCPLCAM